KTGLVKAGLDPLFYEWPPKHDPGRSPYRGMLPLEPDDAGIFFGREAPTNELIARLRGLRDDPPPRFMVILGASGAGKSSFLRAGILPRLSRDERNFLPLPIIRPEHSVLWGEHGLLSALSQVFDQHKLSNTRGALRKLIEVDLGSSKNELITQLIKLIEHARLPRLDGETYSTMPTLVLTVDQGEELFHSEGAEEANLFLSLLVRLVKQTKLPLIILFTIRSDSYEYLQTDKTLDGITQQTFSLTPMPQGAYHNVIEGPALRLKDSDRPLKIEPALVQALLEDIEKGGNKDALPLLAFTLERLYLEYGSDGNLTLEEYHDMGGLEGAIEAAVERALKAAVKDPALPNECTAIKKLLRRGLIPWLAGIDPDTQAPRRRVARLSEIPVEAQAIIDHLIEQRLLATDIDETNSENTIEPAHEALLRQWGLLQGWLEEDFPALTVLESVQRASRDWAANNKTSDWLSHSAGRLKDAEEINQRSDLMAFLNQTDWEYLKACRELEDQQRDRELLEAKRLAETQKRVARRTTLGMVVAVVLTVVAGVLGWQAELSEREALEAGEKVEEKLVEANHN
ncbi:MAG: ATP-binding protein, partial [Aestuariibacter sp.]|nr:ATP-binding protein [Aestuariibacter sp.]